MRREPPSVDLTDVRMTGVGDPRFAPFDDAVVELLRQEDIPGASFAVSVNGKLVHSRGYGVARRGTDRLIQPDTRFRIASVAKPFTAVAALFVAHDRRNPGLLDSPVLDNVNIAPWAGKGKPPDPRLRRITVHHLLRHSGGWDRGKSGDPMFQQMDAARDLGRKPPLGHRDFLEWGLSRPLDFDPGTRTAYSNFGYNLLGRWIEAMTGQDYESYVRDRFLRPMGIGAMRIGTGIRDRVGPDETEYHMPRDSPEPDRPFAEFTPAALDSHGGWVGSAPELLRFAERFDKAAAGGLPADLARRMTRRPEPPLGLRKDGRPAPTFQGLGWMVRPEGQSATVWHLGVMSGTGATLIRRADGIAWALLLNQRPVADIDLPLHAAARLVFG